MFDGSPCEKCDYYLQKFKLYENGFKIQSLEKIRMRKGLHIKLYIQCIMYWTYLVYFDVLLP